jgi:ankyrin repeat protein
MVHWAAAQGDLELVKALVEEGKTPVDIRDRDGRTPLLVAAAGGTTTVIGYLVSQGADLGAVDKAGRTALHLAAREGWGNVIAFFGSKGIRERISPLLTQKDKSGKIPVALAMSENRKDAALQLIALGSPVDVRDAEGMTILHWASGNGYEEIVRLLVSRGARLNERDAKGRVPMHLAATAGHKQIVEILIKAGADTTIPWPRQSWF